MTLGNARLQSAYDAALSGLAGNVQHVDSFPDPLLFEGATYGGAWLECAPLEGLVYAAISPEVARANHEIYFQLQRADGQLPCTVRKERISWSQIQMVVPVAATAWDLYRRQRNAGFLDQAYRACSRWDDWLMKYRNTRGTGLCEAFCEYDTGHDNSPRFRGKPKACPNGDARVCPRVEGLPYLAPDLSATVYGGRVALAAMAREMGRSAEEARWLEQAAAIRKAIIGHLYDARDGAFCDIDSGGQFVRIRGDAITRVVGEHVVDDRMFENIWSRQLHNPKAFWTPYPFPSIAADDPTFVRPIPRNSWGGAAQALTALRTPRWMEYYGKYSALRQLMTRWTEAIARAGNFLQQMDPETGEFSADRGAYSPAMLALLDFSWRLYGVRDENGELEWNCRLPEGSAECVWAVAAAELRTTAAGSVMSIAGREVLRVTGEVRVVTRADGSPTQLVGTSEREVVVRLRRGGRETRHSVRPDQVIHL
jgi:Mannosylglycerate hydrolase MGH1-like glycoside hydrolase domain